MQLFYALANWLALKKIPHANQLAQLTTLIKYGQLMRQLTAKSEIIFFFVERKMVPKANSLIITATPENAL